MDFINSNYKFYRKNMNFKKFKVLRELGVKIKEASSENTISN